ncbi:MAG TPA: hypothetical protein VKT51_06185 [Candidatus Eremiobacteraceae bacterium]|nr:hypothetical protein [Candidatus Eremiobacteraceae bacterium]
MYAKPIFVLVAFALITVGLIFFFQSNDAYATCHSEVGRVIRSLDVASAQSCSNAETERVGGICCSLLGLAMLVVATTVRERRP